MIASRIYLDHAATSWPKSNHLLDAIDQFSRECGVSAGRGSHRSAVQASMVVQSVRREIARLIDAPSPDCISLHSGGTAALNAALHGLLKPGDHVVTTAVEHNSVLRPLRFLEQHRGIETSIVRCDSNGRVTAADVIDAVRPDTRLVAVTHASNVTGAVQPIEQIAAGLRSCRSLLLCDAAQTFGCIATRVRDMGVDLLAAPGHKGGNGPLGTGFLYASPDCHDLLESSIQGGTGSQSESLEMPTDYPQKLEAGSLNVPALAGWLAGLRTTSDLDDSARRCRELAQRLHNGLQRIDGLRLYGQPTELPIASVGLDGGGSPAGMDTVGSIAIPPGDLANILDAEYQIETRAGLHCAALIHQYLGSEPDGTLRISGGPSTSHRDIDAVVNALQAIVGQFVS